MAQMLVLIQEVAEILVLIQEEAEMLVLIQEGAEMLVLINIYRHIQPRVSIHYIIFSYI